MTVEAQPRAASGGSLLYDPRVRSIFFQVVTIAAIVTFSWWIIDNTIANLERQKIASGFGFLRDTAGFKVNQSLLVYSEESSYGRLLVVSILNTLLVAFFGIVLATIIGFIAGVARLSNNWIIARIAAVYIEVFRNIPLLLQIFVWYFAVLRPLPGPKQSVTFGGIIEPGVPVAFAANKRGLYLPEPVFLPGSSAILWALILGILGGIAVTWWAHRRQERTGQQFPVFLTSLGLIVGLPIIAFLGAGSPVEFNYAELKGFNLVGGVKIIPEFTALLLALAIYTGSFIAEIVRAGILAVSHGQTEAAHALGLRSGPTLRLVVIPQAMRVIIPPLTSQYLNLTKNSSLAAAIAYPEIVSVFAGTVLNQTGQAVEVLAITMSLYLSLSILTSIFMNWYNAKMALQER